MTDFDHRKTQRGGGKPGRRMRGFEPAAGLLREPIRKAGESRGFAASKVLTHWAEIVGPELAAQCRPAKVSYAEGGLGGTLTLLASGAAAPMLQMQLPALKERINAAYGYAAIARIRITQTAERLASAPPGLAEAPAPFAAGPSPQAGSRAARLVKGDNFAAPSDKAMGKARAVVTQLTEGVADNGLRDALDRLAENVLSRQKGPGHKPGPH